MQMFTPDFKPDYTTAGLPTPDKEICFTAFLPDKDTETPRPAVLVLPGGGYHCTCDHEGTPVAEEFAKADIVGFVLHYNHSPEAFFPTPQFEAFSAIKFIREHAAEWNIDPNRIVVCGFSAGGHLCASTGVLWNNERIRACGFEDDTHKPNGIIPCYAVITGGEYAHRGSFVNLLGDQYSNEMVELVSLEKQVTEDTPPAFIWHSRFDGCVPVQNSLLFASALAEKNIPFELHIYPDGDHGTSLALGVTRKNGEPANVKTWAGFAAEWVKNL